MTNSLLLPDRFRIRPTWWVALLVAIVGIETVLYAANAWLAKPGDPNVSMTQVLICVIMLVAITTFISVARWWRPVLADAHVAAGVGSLGLRRARWAVAGVFLAVGAGTAFSGGWSDASFLTTTILLVLATGVWEELTYRGMLVTGLRGSRLPEWSVWLISSSVFGLSHMTTLLQPDSDGDVGAALQQSFAAIITGSALYALRLLTGTIIVPMAMHALNNAGLYGATESAGPALTIFATAMVLLNLFATLGLIVYFIVSGVRGARQRGAAQLSH